MGNYTNMSKPSKVDFTGRSSRYYKGNDGVWLTFYEDNGALMDVSMSANEDEAKEKALSWINPQLKFRKPGKDTSLFHGFKFWIRGLLGTNLH